MNSEGSSVKVVLYSVAYISLAQEYTSSEIPLCTV